MLPKEHAFRVQLSTNQALSTCHARLAGWPGKRCQEAGSFGETAVADDFQRYPGRVRYSLASISAILESVVISDDSVALRVFQEAGASFHI